ncbi:MAG: hypothetical protein E6Q33_04575 [Neisseriales bacterium]|nr:MAG: hypothetical protein E6Q33_04575 [Neisseriales bacterium]
MEKLNIVLRSVFLASAISALYACSEGSEASTTTNPTIQANQQLNIANSNANSKVVAYLNSLDFQVPSVESATLANLTGGTWPVTQVNIAFMKPHSTFNIDTAKDSDLANSNTGLSFASDYTLGDLKAFIGQLKAKGITVYISVGGWDYSCYVSGTNGTITDYYNADLGGSNYCEPPQDGYIQADYNFDPTRFDFFPNPLDYAENGVPLFDKSLTNPDLQDTIAQAKQYIQNWVDFAKYVGASGVDLDYEETYYADLSHVASPYNTTGSYSIKFGSQKFASILYNLEQDAKASGLGVSIAAVPVGSVNIDADNGTNGQLNWGGNLKGIYYQLESTSDVPTPSGLPAAATLFSNLSLIGVMTYDLDTTIMSGYCPYVFDGNQLGFANNNTGNSNCILANQVKSYLTGFSSFLSQVNASNVPLLGGIETGKPAYPTGNTSNQTEYYNVPLKPGIADCSAAVVNGEAPSCIDQIKMSTPNGIIFWELNKPTTDLGYTGSFSNLTQSDLNSAATTTDVLNLFK